MPEPRLSPDALLSAYAQGAFPMAGADGAIRWYTADPRGVLPLDSFHVPHTLAQLVRNPKQMQVRFNTQFAATMRACCDCRPDGTWINDRLIAAYVRLHEIGYAHSVETWCDGELVGGLYGVSLGGAFFGESMFHRRTNASKLALVHLVNRLKERGFELLDAQASTPHLKRFGCVEIPASDYLRRLERAMSKRCVFD